MRPAPLPPWDRALAAGAAGHRAAAGGRVDGVGRVRARTPGQGVGLERRTGLEAGGAARGQVDLADVEVTTADQGADVPGAGIDRRQRHLEGRLGAGHGIGDGVDAQLLHGGIEREGDLEPAAVEGLGAVGLLDVLAGEVDEVGVGRGPVVGRGLDPGGGLPLETVAHQSDVEIHGLLVLRLADELLGEHLLQHTFALELGPLGIGPGGVARGGADDPGDEGRLAEVELAHRLAEPRFGGCAHAVETVAEVGGVEVEEEDLVLVDGGAQLVLEPGLELHRHQRFVELAFVGAVALGEGVLDVLLRDGGSALDDITLLVVLQRRRGRRPTDRRRGGRRSGGPRRRRPPPSSPGGCRRG